VRSENSEVMLRVKISQMLIFVAKLRFILASAILSEIQVDSLFFIFPEGLK
jgi:hypothetical protein